MLELLVVLLLEAERFVIERNGPKRTSMSNNYIRLEYTCLCPRAVPQHYDEIIEQIHIRWLKTFKYTKAKSFRRILSWLDFEKICFSCQRMTLLNLNLL